MVDFGDELIIDSYRIPWLIWIQLVVMFLLIILLYFFSLDQSLPSTTASSSSAAPFLSSGAAAADGNAQQARENQITKETGSGVNREIQRREDPREIESSTKDGTSATRFAQAHHPCHFLGLAKQAFLKCLGLDFSESSSNTNQREH